MQEVVILPRCSISTFFVSSRRERVGGHGVGYIHRFSGAVSMHPRTICADAGGGYSAVVQYKYFLRQLQGTKVLGHVIGHRLHHLFLPTQYSHTFEPLRCGRRWLFRPDTL